MKITIDRKRMERGVVLCAGVVNETLMGAPLTDRVALEARDDLLICTGVNDRASAVVKVKCQVHEPGSFQIQAAMIAKAVKSCPSGDITVEQSGTKATISSGHATTYNLTTHGGSASSYLKTPARVDTDPVELDAPALRELLEAVAYAATTAEAKNQQGVWLVSDGDRIRAVGSDTHRMATDLRKCGPDARLPEGVFLYTPGIRALAAFVDKREAPVSFRFDSRQSRAMVEGDDVTLWCAADGNYIPWEKVLPSKDGSVVATVDRAELAQVLDRMDIIYREAKSTFGMTIGDGAIDISVHTQEYCLGNEQVSAEVIGTGAAPLYCNLGYLLHWLRRSSGDKVALHYHGALRPMRLDTLGSDYVGVVMPLDPAKRTAAKSKSKAA